MTIIFDTSSDLLMVDRNDLLKVSWEPLTELLWKTIMT